MDVRSFKLLLHLLRPHLWAVPVLVLLGLLSSVAEGLSIGLLIPLLSTLLEQRSNSTSPIIEILQGYAALFPPERQIPLLLLSLLVLVFLKSLVSYANGSLSSWVSGKISHTLRLHLFRQVLDVGYAFLCVTDNGKLLNTLDSETWQTTDAITTIFDLITTCCMILVFVSILLMLSWPLTLSLAAGMAVVSLVVRLLTRRARGMGEEAVAASHALSQRSVDAFDGMRVIRAFGQEGSEERKYSACSNEVRRIDHKISLLLGRVHPLLELFYVLLFIGVILIAWSVGVSVPTLLAFLLLAYRFQPHIKRLDQARVHLATLSGAVRAVCSLLNRGDKPYIHSGAVKFVALNNAIEFRAVNFSYGVKDETRPALHNVSLRIRAGETTAIVGGSGGGKSTLVNLLYRFYDPDRGIILVDDQPLTELDLKSWRGSLAIAGQDADLINGTIHENIAYSLPDADEAAVIEAARRANAHDFIERLPEKYRSRVGERGVLLSGGQRQRIGLARALLRQPKILILDEATNSLDSVTKSYIQDTLERLHGQLTIVVIAHRLSTTRNADHVIVLNEGRVVEAGLPSELLRAKGLFSRFHELQKLEAYRR